MDVLSSFGNAVAESGVQHPGFHSLRAQPCQVAKQQAISLCTIWVTFSLGAPCSHVTKYTFTA